MSSFHILSVLCSCLLLQLDVTNGNIQVEAGNNSRSFEDKKADFGPPLSDSGIGGHGVIVSPQDACKPIKPPINRVAYSIAIIKRGSCDFDLKVFHAQNAKYNAAIVYNDKNDRLKTMGAKNYSGKITIPSVFVGNSSGVKIMNLVKQYKSAFITITPNYNFPWNFYFIPFAIVVSISFLIMSLIMICKCRELCAARREARLARANLNRLKVVKFKKGDEYDICAICLDDYNEGDKLRILPCKHAYHCKCIDPWLTDSKRECPVCKRKVNLSVLDDMDTPSEDTPLLA